MAALDPRLFREIYAFACRCYEEDSASYHVSAEIERSPLPGDPARRSYRLSWNSSTHGRYCTLLSDRY